MTDRPLFLKWNVSKSAAPSGEASPPEKPAPPRFKVSELLGPAREVVLEHGGQEYRLRITANHKLILTK